MRVQIRLKNGEIITRKVYVEQLGNFQQQYVRYDNAYYMIGDGDEYLRGQADIYTLGKRIER